MRPSVGTDHARLVRGIAASALVFALTGCGAASYEEMGLHSAKGAIRGVYEGAKALPEPLLRDILADKAVRTAAYDLARSMVAGASDGMAAGRLDETTGRVVSAVFAVAREQGNQAVKQLLDEQGPRLQILVSQTLSTSIRQATSTLRESAKSDLSMATNEITGTAVRSLATALMSDEARAAQESMATAAGDIAERAAQRAMEGAVRGLRNELTKEETLLTITTLARAASRGTAEGVKDSLRGDPSQTLWLEVAIILVALLIGCVSALIVYFRRSNTHAHMLAIVAETVNKAERESLDPKEVKKRIREKAERGGVEKELSAFLKARGL